MNTSFIQKIKSVDRFELLELYNKTDVYTVEALKAIEDELQKRELDFEAHDYAFLQQQEDEDRGLLKIDLEEDLLDAKPVFRLYSKEALWGFSLIISPLFASVLFLINLIKLNKASAGYLVLLAMIAFQITSNYIILRLTENIFLGILPNVIGGYLLANVFWNYYIGKHISFQKKDLKSPILIATFMVLISLIFIYMR